MSSARTPRPRISRAASMSGWISLQAAYGLTVISSIIQRSPRLSVRRLTAGSAVEIRQNPYLPASPSAGPSKPSAASRAAVNPPSAALPAWSRLVSPPLWLNSVVPDEKVAAIPRALVIVPDLKSRRCPTAAAEPNTPDWPVGWKPASMWDAGPTAMPARPIASYPTTIASRTASPEAPVSAAMASTAGMTTAPGCEMASSCTSSNSKAWPDAPLAKAAIGAEVANPEPTTGHGPPSPPVRRAWAAARWLHGFPAPNTMHPRVSTRQSTARSM